MKEDNYYYKLFEHLHENYGLTLLDSEMDDIIIIVEDMLKEKI